MDAARQDPSAGLAPERVTANAPQGVVPASWGAAAGKIVSVAMLLMVLAAISAAVAKAAGTPETATCTTVANVRTLCTFNFTAAISTQYEVDMDLGKLGFNEGQGWMECGTSTANLTAVPDFFWLSDGAGSSETGAASAVSFTSLSGQTTQSSNTAVGEYTWTASGRPYHGSFDNTDQWAYVGFKTAATFTGGAVCQGAVQWDFSSSVEKSPATLLGETYDTTATAAVPIYERLSGWIVGCLIFVACVPIIRSITGKNT